LLEPPTPYRRPQAFNRAATGRQSRLGRP
jgi:hypothetical protein